MGNTIVVETVIMIVTVFSILAKAIVKRKEKSNYLYKGVRASALYC